MEISVDELEKMRNDYAQLGMELEKARIIKLLEELTTKAHFPALDPAGQALRTIDWAIALIKEKQND